MLALTFNSLAADILAKKAYLFLPMLLWTLSSAGWLYMLRIGVPLGRSMGVCCVMSFVLTALVASTLFGEPMTVTQMIGCVLGVASIGLLV